jgi:hypothetical protein
MQMLRSVFTAALLASALSSAALAQERVPNPGKSGIIRSWPDSGVWGVALARLVDGGLGCWLGTGHTNTATGEKYIWGLRWRLAGLGVAIVDNNEWATRAPSIEIIVDRISIGTFSITRTIDLGNGFRNVVADLQEPDAGKLVELMGVAGTIQLSTKNFSYSAPLQGASQALANLKACTIEVGHLNSSSAEGR